MSRSTLKHAAMLLLLALASGCAGENQFISTNGQKVERGTLDLRNIPVRPQPKEYVIGQGDALDVLFLYNSEFNQIDLKVRPDGKISLPYAGEVMAAGKGVSELDSLLKARFSEIIVDPSITVVVRNYSPLVVYVMGEVEHPGGYEYKRGMTLTNALALASGPGPKGSRNDIVVIRKIAADHIVGIQINLNDLFGQKHFNLDIPLEAYDIVYVPKSKLASTADFATTLQDILLAPAEVYLKGWAVFNVEYIYDYYRRSGVAP